MFRENCVEAKLFWIFQILTVKVLIVTYILITFKTFGKGYATTLILNMTRSKRHRGVVFRDSVHHNISEGVEWPVLCHNISEGVEWSVLCHSIYEGVEWSVLRNIFCSCRAGVVPRAATSAVISSARYCVVTFLLAPWINRASTIHNLWRPLVFWPL